MVRLYEHEIEIRDLHTLALIRRQTRARRKGAVELPDAERLFNPPARHTRSSSAPSTSAHTHALCRALFEQRGREAQKSMWGIVGLHPRYPACILEQAAASALARHIHAYKAVRAIAEQLLAQAIARLDGTQPELPLGDAGSPLTQQHALIRDPAEYAAFFNRSVGTEPLAPDTPAPSQATERVQPPLGEAQAQDCA
ncbi:MAG: hypothetical protein IPI02_05480 [Sterolibacteriaceae bacterium]|nr:hypothetical protein [Sterolibacteriaceae bacterium]